MGCGWNHVLTSYIVYEPWSNTSVKFCPDQHFNHYKKRSGLSFTVQYNMWNSELIMVGMNSKHDLETEGSKILSISYGERSGTQPHTWAAFRAKQAQN